MPASTKSMMTACAAVALLAAVLSGCGGGGSGGPVAGEGDMPSVDGDGDGMMPDDADTAMPIIELRAFSRAYSRDNPTAEDLLDHWNAPQTLRTAVGLSAVGQSGIAERKSHLKALLDGAVGNPENAGAGFRNVGADDVEIIGEKNGITYGQWKGGPAGTLNIEIDWRFSSIDDPLLQALAERAGSPGLDDYWTNSARMWFQQGRRSNILSIAPARSWSQELSMRTSQRTAFSLPGLTRRFLVVTDHQKCLTAPILISSRGSE